MNTRNVLQGLLAGLAGTLAMSAIMIVKKVAGVLPGIDPIGLITATAHAKVGLPDTPVVGWVMHFMIGSVFGILFSVVSPKLKGSEIARGIYFASIAWLIMMLAVMPMAGAGLFGLELGAPAPIVMLMMHVVYGAVLGTVYGKVKA